MSTAPSPLSVGEILERAHRLKVNFAATLRYWALYRASGDPSIQPAIDSSDGLETNGIVVIRIGMLRLVVLNLRRALEPADRSRRWSLMSLLALLPINRVHQIALDRAIAKQSGYGTADRRVAIIEECRSRISIRYASDDARWIRDHRDEDIAHSNVNDSDKWSERSVDQLHDFLIGTSADAYQLCDALMGAPTAQNVYEMFLFEAQEFWRTFIKGIQPQRGEAAVSGN